MNHTYDLDTPLIEFPSGTGRDRFTIRHAVEGVQVFGGIGSGKSSGSGYLLATKYLAAGFGGLVLTAKPDELKIWKTYCRQAGRERDLVVIEPGGARFNVLDYASGYGSGELTPTTNIVEVLQTVIQAGAAQDSGRGDDAFWRDSFDLLLNNVIDLCKLAYGRVSAQDLHDIVQNTPKADQPAEEGRVNHFNRAFEAARAHVNRQVDDWAATLNDQERIRLRDDAAFEAALLDAVADARLLKFVDGFFVDTLMHLSEKTRSIIELMFQSFLLRLLREPFFSLFCRYPSTVTPEDCLDGKIVVVNLPVKVHNKAGRDAQLLVKSCFQRAWEKRDVTRNGRPLFLWADESQSFLLETDAIFQATARSSRVATVYLSQNLPNYIASMGGHLPEYRVRAFLGTLATKIFHANADYESNDYASKLIGDGYFVDRSQNVTVGSGSFSQSMGQAHRLERMVRPEQFVRLRTGGPLNHHKVEAYLHRQGDSFLNGCNHLKVTFNQNSEP